MVTAATKVKSVSNDKPKAQSATTDKPKRKTLSPAEKIAKLEADLKAAKNKLHDKDRKVVADKQSEVNKLKSKREELTFKIASLEVEIADAQKRIEGPHTDGVGDVPASATS